jgi:predicted transcriptional regulator
MEKELLRPDQDAIPKQKPKKREEILDKERTLDLAILTSTAFNYVAKREESVIGRISIYEIDKELEAREREAIPGPEDQ